MLNQGQISGARPRVRVVHLAHSDARTRAHTHTRRRARTRQAPQGVTASTIRRASAPAAERGGKRSTQLAAATPRERWWHNVAMVRRSMLKRMWGVVLTRSGKRLKKYFATAAVCSALEPRTRSAHAALSASAGSTRRKTHRQTDTTRRRSVAASVCDVCLSVCVCAVSRSARRGMPQAHAAQAGGSSDEAFRRGLWCCCCWLERVVLAEC